MERAARRIITINISKHSIPLSFFVSSSHLFNISFWFLSSIFVLCKNGDSLRRERCTGTVSYLNPSYRYYCTLRQPQEGNCFDFHAKCDFMPSYPFRLHLPDWQQLGVQNGVQQSLAKSPEHRKDERSRQEEVNLCAYRKCPAENSLWLQSHDRSWLIRIRRRDYRSPIQMTRRGWRRAPSRVPQGLDFLGNREKGNG